MSPSPALMRSSPPKLTVSLKAPATMTSPFESTTMDVPLSFNVPPRAFAHAPQVPFTHAPLTQSVATPHSSWFAHPPQAPPPQSMSLSMPLATASSHAGTAHLPSEQIPLSQS